jgi:hypothetical protein
MKPRKQKRFALPDLVWVIGCQLTAYIGRTTVEGIAEWLQSELPEELVGRMKTALDVALPIAEVESELIAQGFLIEKLDDLEPYKFPVTMLRDADDVQAARAVLIERAKKEFLDCETSDLEDVECRLKAWIAQAKMPPRTKYKVLLWDDRLSLELLHVGFSVEQQVSWDKGQDWPLWAELIAELPEMAVSRTCPDIQSGCPFRYLRRAGAKHGLPFLNSPAKRKWLRQTEARIPASKVVTVELAPYELEAPWRLDDKNAQQRQVMTFGEIGSAKTRRHS